MRGGNASAGKSFSFLWYTHPSSLRKSRPLLQVRCNPPAIQPSPYSHTAHAAIVLSPHHYAQSILGSASTKNIYIRCWVLASNNMTKLSALTFLILCFDNVIIFWHFVSKRNVNLFISTRHTPLMFRNASRSVWHLLFNISSCWTEQPSFISTAQCFFADGKCVSRDVPSGTDFVTKWSLCVTTAVQYNTILRNEMNA